MKYIRTRCAGIVQEKTYGKRKFRSIEGRKFLEQTTKLAHDFLRNKKIWSPCTWLFWHTEYFIWQRHTKRGCISLIRFIVSGCDRIGSHLFIRQYVLFGTFGIRNEFIVYSTNNNCLRYMFYNKINMFELIVITIVSNIFPFRKFCFSWRL